MGTKIISALLSLSVSLNVYAARDITSPAPPPDAYSNSVEDNTQINKLTAIYYTKKDKKALIDGIWFRPGQRIGSIKVLVIYKNKVLIENEGKSIELIL